jgi:hypothetical protein
VRTLQVQFIPFNTIDEESYHRPGAKKRNPGSPGRNYEYLYTGDREVKVDDWAIVHNGEEFGMVRISRVFPGIRDKVHKHVITVITQEDFQNYLEANRDIQRHREIFDQLDGMLEAESKLERYRRLAENNPYAAELLEKAGVWTGKAIEAQQSPPIFAFSSDERAVPDTPDRGYAEPEKDPLDDGIPF